MPFRDRDWVFITSHSLKEERRAAPTCLRNQREEAGGGWAPGAGGQEGGSGRRGHPGSWELSSRLASPSGPGSPAGWLCPGRHKRGGQAGGRFKDSETQIPWDCSPLKYDLCSPPQAPHQSQLCCGPATLGSANKGSPGVQAEKGHLGPPASLWLPCSRCSKLGHAQGTTLGPSGMLPLASPLRPPDRSAPGPGHSR